MGGLRKRFRVARYCRCGAIWEGWVSRSAARTVFSNWERLHSAPGCAVTDRNGAFAGRIKRDLGIPVRRQA